MGSAEVFCAGFITDSAADFSEDLSEGVRLYEMEGGRKGGKQGRREGGKESCVSHGHAAL